MENYPVVKKLNLSISVEISLIVKGIAICAMLWHHLFLSTVFDEATLDFSPLTIYLAQTGKICVALFLFLSGYGLAVKYDKIVETSSSAIEFINKTLILLFKRFAHFYANYWIIFLIFVPIGVYVFNRPLSAAYGEHENIIIGLTLDVLGLQAFKSYNITWWFNKLIIICYLVFPLLFFICKKINWVFVLMISCLFPRLHIASFGVDFSFWQLSFLLGILWALNVNKLEVLLNKYNFDGLKVLIFSFVVLSALLFVRYLIGNMRLDAFISLTLIILVSQLFEFKKMRIFGILSFLGKHVANIYMVHTFIYAYWFPDYIYLNMLF